MHDQDPTNQAPRLFNGPTEPVTLTLLALCVLVFVLQFTPLALLVYSQLFISLDQSLNAVGRGELWRLITPILIHFSLLHLLFNGVWIYQFGSAIEQYRSGWHLLSTVMLIAIGSNLAQFYHQGPNFGGMSGVVYGLFGFCWIQGHLYRVSALYLPQGLIIVLLGWLMLCMTGLLGPIANAAHLSGLLLGIVLALVQPPGNHSKHA